MKGKNALDGSFNYGGDVLTGLCALLVGAVELVVGTLCLLTDYKRRRKNAR